MKRVVAAVLALVLASPAFADDKADLILKQLTEISSRLDQMNKDSEARASEFNKLRADVDRLRTDLDALARKEPSKVKEEPKKPEPGRTDTVRVPLRQAEATVLIRNSWTETAVVSVNGEWYRVPSGVSRQVRVPSGTFNYSIVGVCDVQSRGVSPEETFVISVYTLPQTAQYCR